MASIIWLGIRKQKPLKDHLSKGNSLNSRFYNPYSNYVRPVIAKGNIIEGITAE